MKNALNWFEIPSSDFSRAKNFYNKIFGFEMQEMNMGDSLLAFFPAEEGVGGALVKDNMTEPSAKGTMVYLNGGEDLDKVLSNVEKAGGKVLVPKTMITEEYGFMGIFIDTEGNRVGLHSAK